MEKILGIGNALVDALVALPDDTLLREFGLPKGSMQLIDKAKFKIISDSFNRMDASLATGGSAANTTLALACLGATTGFIGKLGEDEYGQFFRNNLATHGIEDKILAHKTLPSGVASTFISPDGERTFGTYLGAAATLEANELTPAMFDGYTYLYIEGYLVQNHSMILRAIDLAKATGLQICLDLASYNIVEDDREFFTLLVEKYVDILFANEEEAKAFTGPSIEEALDILGRLCSIAVVKVGSKGSYIRKGTDTARIVPPYLIRPVDTTGAGDYYAAGFLYGLMSGYSLEKCGKIGSVLGGKVIQTVGTTLSAEAWHEIKLNINEILAE
jgi:sugar/nucleoside kinase (ribokinase family)